MANLRDIAWRTMGINFTLVASPGLLERAPHTHIATVRADDAAQGKLLRDVTDALPNVSGIRVADVLATVGTLFSQLATALAATGVADARGGDAGAGRRRGLRAAAADRGGGDPEDARGVRARRSARRGWWSSAFWVPWPG